MKALGSGMTVCMHLLRAPVSRRSPLVRLNEAFLHLWQFCSAHVLRLIVLQMPFNIGMRCATFCISELVRIGLSETMRNKSLEFSTPKRLQQWQLLTLGMHGLSLELDNL
jgi:hypothetical protein